MLTVTIRRDREHCIERQRKSYKLIMMAPHTQLSKPLALDLHTPANLQRIRPNMSLIRMQVSSECVSSEYKSHRSK
jgi:hypothetical protein